MESTARRTVASAERQAARAAPRFTGSRRRSFTWTCPHPSAFGILVVYAVHDVILQLSGELDLAGRDAFDDCVTTALEATPRRLVLELSALDFTDVVGMRSFVKARLLAEAAGVQLILDSPNRLVRWLLGSGEVLNDFGIR